MVAVHSTLLGVLSVMDPIKPEARGVVAALHHMGIQCLMLTGDNWRTARTIAEQLGINGVLAEVLPAGKAKKIKVLQSSARLQVPTAAWHSAMLLDLLFVCGLPTRVVSTAPVKLLAPADIMVISAGATTREQAPGSHGGGWCE